ncbi:MAG: hypothetical protein AAFS13_03030 [Pseudomonadota bacterium]
MKMKLGLGVIAAFGLVACATAPEATEEAAVAAETVVAQAADETVVAEAEEERVICKNTQVIGSNFKKRICGTQAEWDEMEASTDTASQYIRKSIRSQSAFDN